jgi:hypothetical protein
MLPSSHSHHHCICTSPRGIHRLYPSSRSHNHPQISPPTTQPVSNLADESSTSSDHCLHNITSRPIGGHTCGHPLRTIAFNPPNNFSPAYLSFTPEADWLAGWTSKAS